MVFLKSFQLLNAIGEHKVYESEIKNIYATRYPLGIFPLKQLETLSFAPITIFYGNNGSGKSTVLNIIAQKCHAKRITPLNKGIFFDNYIERCQFELHDEGLQEIKVITSDDIFDYLLNIRAINTGVDRQKELLIQQYLDAKYDTRNINQLDTYDSLKEKVDARSKTMSRYVREKLMTNTIQEQSNGESALMFWEKEITENAVYILDEPENSLSASNQKKLCKFIEESARFYNCQFILSTHSPFLLSLKGAMIYDLDDVPVRVKKWTELENIQEYYQLFKNHDSDF